MKTFLTAMGGAIIGMVLGVVILALIAAAVIGGAISSATAPEEQADVMVLSLDMRNGLDDQAPTSGPEALFSEAVGFTDIILRLDAAATDERVKGLIIRTSEIGVGFARAEEYTDALQKFQDSGKFVLAHSQGIYGSASAYQAIAGADEIWLQPASELIASGLSFETLFLKGLFDNLSITPDFVALYEFKNAVNTYQETDYTDAHRLAMTELGESIWTSSIEAIADQRKLSADAVRGVLETGPLSTTATIEAGLIDQIGWPQDVENAALERAGEDAALQSIMAYIPPSAPFRAPAIAIVGGEGPIVTGDTGGSFFSEGNSFASDSISAALMDAAENESVSAIVFRVDSPGGSPTASDQIWHTIETIKSQHEKPVIVSMAGVAASGGYYVSAGADWIIANPSTITGSIGIFGGKFGIEDALQRIGVNAERIAIGGDFAGAFSSTAPFTDDQRTQIRAWLQRGYDRFIGLVAEGRDMSVDAVDQRARGRVWSGRDAMRMGLVDELGNFMSAIEKAKELAEIEADTEVRFIKYPQPDGNFFLSTPMVSASAQQLAAFGLLADTLDDPAVQGLLTEVDAARSPHLQARVPHLGAR